MLGIIDRRKRTVVVEQTVSVSGTREQISELNRHSVLVRNMKSVNLTQSLASHESGTEPESMVENRQNTRDEYGTLRLRVSKCARSVKSPCVRERVVTVTDQSAHRRHHRACAPPHLLTLTSFCFHSLFSPAINTTR